MSHLSEKDIAEILAPVWAARARRAAEQQNVLRS